MRPLPAETVRLDRARDRFLAAPVKACLLALADPRLGILVWIVVPTMAVVRKKKRKPGVAVNSGEN